ncbi:MAG: zinc ribbon domain-containing protein [Lachnospiraceae bacterium]
MKGALYGKTVVLVPPNYTTQTCSVCGYVMKGEEHLTLKTREWECPNCHTIHHRDTNRRKKYLGARDRPVKRAGYPFVTRPLAWQLARG